MPHRPRPTPTPVGVSRGKAEGAAPEETLSGRALLFTEPRSPHRPHHLDERYQRLGGAGRRGVWCVAPVLVLLVGRTTVARLGHIQPGKRPGRRAIDHDWAESARGLPRSILHVQLRGLLIEEYGGVGPVTRLHIQGHAMRQ